MRKLVFGLLTFLLFSAVTVFAVECKDLDEQPDIEDTLGTAAKVEYGLTPETDKCLHASESYSQDPGPWVREFFCETVSTEGQTIIKRSYRDYECVRYGFEKCAGGKCVGGSTTGTTTTKTLIAEPPRCGDKKIQPERGEQCDPPDSICYLDVNGKSHIGVCTRPDPVTKIGGCACKLYQAGDNATPEQPGENKETITPPVTPPEEQPPAPDEKQPVNQTHAEREPLPTEKMEDPKGVGVTRAITNSIKRFFSWFGSWFK